MSKKLKSLFLPTIILLTQLPMFWAETNVLKKNESGLPTSMEHEGEYFINSKSKIMSDMDFLQIQKRKLKAEIILENKSEEEITQKENTQNQKTHDGKIQLDKIQEGNTRIQIQETQKVDSQKGKTRKENSQIQDFQKGHNLKEETRIERAQRGINQSDNEMEKILDTYEGKRRALRQGSRKSFYDCHSATSAMKNWPNLWNPPPDRFLLAYCEWGEITSRKFCFLRAIRFAASVNRTLLLTMNSNAKIYHSDRHLIFDIDYFRSCYGINTLMTVDEYKEIYGQDVIVDQVLCDNTHACHKDLDFVNHKGPLENWDANIKFDESTRKLQKITKRSSLILYEDLVENYLYAPGRVLFMGEFYFNALQLESDLGFPIERWEVARLESDLFIPVRRSEQCDSNIGLVPHKHIMESARLFLEGVLEGQSYMGVHLRRGGDYEAHCSNDKECYPPIEKIVDCLREKIKNFKIKAIYLTRTTFAEEMAYIVENLSAGGEDSVRLIQLGVDGMKFNLWSAPISDKPYKIRKGFRAELEKVICARSHVFLGSNRSSFSLDIQRMRYGFRTSDPRDSYICENLNDGN